MSRSNIHPIEKFVTRGIARGTSPTTAIPEPVDTHHRNCSARGDERYESRPEDACVKPSIRRITSTVTAAEHEARDVQLVEVGREIQHRVPEVRTSRDIDIQQISELTDRDQNTGAGGEPEQHRTRREVDEHAEPGKTEDDAQDADHHRHHAGRNQVLRGPDGCQWRQNREDQNRDRVGRSGRKVSRGPPQGAGDRRHRRRVEPVGGGQAGNRRVGDALRNGEHRHRRTGHQIGTDVAPTIPAQNLQRSRERPGVSPQRILSRPLSTSGPKHSRGR